MKLLNRKLTIWIVIAAVVAPLVAAGCGSKDEEAAAIKPDEAKAPPVKMPPHAKMAAPRGAPRTSAED